MPLDSDPSQDTYNAPTSSPDPYASPTDASFPSNYQSPFTAHINLPRGLPILGPLFGYTNTNLGHLIHARFAHLSQTLSRPLSETELSAIALHTAKGHAVASYGPALGVAAGLYRCYATKNEFRWPFYGALKVAAEEVEKGKMGGVNWDGETLRIGEKEVMKQIPTGQKALLLHCLRGGAYVGIGLLLVPMAVSAYGATVSAVGEIRDQRLAAVTRELRLVVEKEQKDRAARRGEVVQERVGQTTGQGRTDAGVLWRERRERLQGGKGEDDDMSPTGGGIGFGDDDEQGRLGGVGDMGGILSDGQMQEKEAQIRPEAGRSPTGNRASTFQMDKVARQPRNFGDDDDDASPTSGSNAGGGSAWERIRQQNASGSSPASSSSRGSGLRREQQQGSTLGDSFSFSSSEEERSYAKDEAQKEFDERVEKERRGGDFSGSGRRW